MKNNGSIMVLAIIAVMILSIILAAGLMVTGTETSTTQNMYLSKLSYYTMVQGVEEVANMIRVTSNPSGINSDMLPNSDRIVGAFKYKYITGYLEELQLNAVQNIAIYTGLTPPPGANMSLAIQGQGGLQPVIWDVKVTSRVEASHKRAYSEVNAGIYSVVFTGY